MLPGARGNRSGGLGRGIPPWPARAFPLALAVSLAALLARPGDARAQADAGAPVCTCSAEHQEIARLESAQRACDAQRSSCESDRAACADRVEHVNAELGTTRRQLDESNAAGAACHASRDQMCSTSGEIVADVLQLRGELPALDACVPPANRRALADMVASWRNGRFTLQRLEAFARGDTDVLPPLNVAGHGEVESLAQRLAGGGRDAPLVYRRLLVEAVRRLAPRFWDALRAAGRDAVDAWFASGEDLDPAFVAEVQAALAARGGGNSPGPSQSAALRYVRTFQDLVGCNSERVPLRQCARAGQLQAFLESSTALIVRQRVREIWHAECSAVGPGEILSWLREFPSPQPSLGRAEWNEVIDAGYDKLVACYLADTKAGDVHFPDWLTLQLPGPAELTNRSLLHLDELRARWEPASPEALCLTAARALRELPAPTGCALPRPAAQALRAWFERQGTVGRAEESLPLRACTTYVDTLWRGHRATVLGSFPGVPSSEELVHAEGESAPSNAAALRSLCERRVGSGASFAADLREVALVASAAGEDITATPWRMDAAGARPLEAAGFDRAARFWSWARHALTGADACAAMGLPEERCTACAPGRVDRRYDCNLVAAVEERWRLWQRVFGGTLLAAVVAVFGARWALSLRRSLRAFGAWRREVVGHLEGLGLSVASDPWGLLFPSRMAVVRLGLPAGPWERWGRSLTVVHTESGQEITERDVRNAALAARAHEGELAVVTHDESASPNLAAVRAMLDWAARGPRGAVQVLPVSTNRLRWASSPDDLLDLVEQVSLRGNPFEVRGRLVSSSQFFNRERLVSGLLAAAQAGSWTVITGLRRFGKSSLALEVGRRLQAPHAYIDLAGFHHEITSGSDPTRSVDAILRYTCRQLHASARSLYRGAALPEPPGESASVDTDALTSWTRAFLAACKASRDGRAVTPLVIFDEVEQAIGVGADRISHAIDVLSILVGRLRASFADSLATHGGDRVGVLFCSAIHAALWAPLTTLGRQSLLGAFQSVSVPRLPEDAAFAMMRGLGARQGIRFTEQALALIVREAQGIPILVRRIGSSVLDLYDPERARQGSLGAVEIGVEGAAAAVRREEEDGAPLRVWVESEIGDLRSPVGGLLRLIARKGTVPVEELKQAAVEATAAQFTELGLERVLGPEETRRRAQEAAGFLVRMLDEIGILVPEGDVTAPHAFSFPDSIVRRILASEGSESLLGF